MNTELYSVSLLSWQWQSDRGVLWTLPVPKFIKEECALALTFQGGWLCRGGRTGDRRKYMSVPEKETETKKTDSDDTTQSVQQVTGFSCDDSPPVNDIVGRQLTCKGLCGILFWNGSGMLGNWFDNFLFISVQWGMSAPVDTELQKTPAKSCLFNVSLYNRTETFNQINAQGVKMCQRVNKPHCWHRCMSTLVCVHKSMKAHTHARGLLPWRTNWLSCNSAGDTLVAQKIASIQTVELKTGLLFSSCKNPPWQTPSCWITSQYQQEEEIIKRGFLWHWYSKETLHMSTLKSMTKNQVIMVDFSCHEILNPAGKGL